MLHVVPFIYIYKLHNKSVKWLDRKGYVTENQVSFQKTPKNWLFRESGEEGLTLEL